MAAPRYLRPPRSNGRAARSWRACEPAESPGASFVREAGDVGVGASHATLRAKPPVCCAP
eukprot:scaffold8123_cov66-Phaeocystis_antarctica.AAC.6